MDMADVWNTLDAVLGGVARPDLEGIAALLPQTRMWVRQDRLTQRYVLVREDEEYPGTPDDGFEVVTMATGSKAALEMAAAVPGLLTYIRELEKELEKHRGEKAKLVRAAQVMLCERGEWAPPGWVWSNHYRAWTLGAFEVARGHRGWYWYNIGNSQHLHYSPEAPWLALEAIEAATATLVQSA